MNNTCPSCGALYNVASKDIGRKLKCKKCGSSLRVTDAGLELDASGSAERPAEADLDRDDRDARDLDEPAPKKKKSRVEREPGINPLVAVGGIPTILFATGVFFVIVFISFPLIGQAGTERANAYKDRLRNDMMREKFELKPKKPVGDWTSEEKEKIDKETPKIESKYDRLIEQAALDAESTRIANSRDHWMESYGIMFGFLLVAFGCIGYLRTEQHLVLKIVAGVVLTLMLFILFLKFSGCQGPR